MVQTSYDIIKTHEDEISVEIPLEKVETLSVGERDNVDKRNTDNLGKENGSTFAILLPII